MKASGNYRLPNLIIFVICFSAGVFPLASIAGNSWMMEKNRDELLMLNAKLLEQLGALNEDGEIILSGKVVIRNGQTLLQLDTLQKFSSRDKVEKLSSEDMQKPKQKYKVFIRETSLSEIPIIESTNPVELDENL